MGDNHIFPRGDAQIQKPVTVLNRAIQPLNPKRRGEWNQRQLLRYGQLFQMKTIIIFSFHI
jgi:hypothetical protein